MQSHSEITHDLEVIDVKISTALDPRPAGHLPIEAVRLPLRDGSTA